MNMNQPSAALRVAAGTQLPGRPIDEEPPIATRDTIDEASAHRVTGLLWHAIETGEVLADDDTRDVALTAAHASWRTCLIAEAVAVRAATTLAAAGLSSRLLKGVAIAHIDHESPNDRVFGDCDLLVRRSELAAALQALTADGWTRQVPALRNWWERRFAKAVVLDPPGGEGELDLHLSVAAGWFGEHIDMDEVWARSTPFGLGGSSVAALHQDDRLLQAACHAVLGLNSGLRAQRDVAQLVLVTLADWESLRDRLQRADAQLVLATAINETWDALYLDDRHPAARWAASEHGTETQARAIAGYRDAFTVGWAPEGRVAISALSRRDRLLYATGVLIPSRANLRSRGRNLPQHLARLLLGAARR